MKLLTAPKIKGLIEAECYHTKLLIAKRRRLGFAVTPDMLIDFIEKKELSDVEVSNLSEGDVLGESPDGGFENQKQEP